jgi:gamma-glutamyltranspeptidase/glutathione hydrolase
MYDGPWGQDFVRIVAREGGKVTAQDLKRYEPIWSEPYETTVFGHRVYVNGPPHQGAYGLFIGLNLSEVLGLEAKPPYWTDASVFRDLARVGQIAVYAPGLGSATSRVLESKRINVAPRAQLGKEFARSVAPLLGQIFESPTPNQPKHSHAIVVVDKDGNIAAVTHTINTVIWGDTGIVVGGIPIPDSAGFQQYALARIKPGDRVPHQIIDTIAFDGDTPVLATGSIGSSLAIESIRVLLGVLGKKQDLAAIIAATPLLSTFDFGSGANSPSKETVAVPHRAYTADFLAELKSLGVNVTELPSTTAAGLRGTLAAVVIDSITGKRHAVNQPGVMVFNVAE